MKGRAVAWCAGCVLALIHLAILGAGFLAPYDPTEQHREAPLSSPEWRSSSGAGHPFLLGTDEFGRDQLSRLLYGGRISIAAGVAAALLALVIGLGVGTVAGYYGGWVDAVLMRVVELFLALPWLYLLLGVRAFLPLSLDPGAAFLLISLVIGLVGWARPARLVRGIVLSAALQEHVQAARAFGASDAYLLRRHILPETRSVLLTQALLLIPQYILAEVAFSFLGLGVGPPDPSWGNMLASLRHFDVLTSAWWLAAPAPVLTLIVCGYYLLAAHLEDGLQAYNN